MVSITTVHGREVFDSRGTPTVEADVSLSDGSFGRAIVPSGASTGIYEALELRDDGESRLGGKGVRQAVGHVNTEIAQALRGFEGSQAELDQIMLDLDGTDTKSKLGANAILAVSMAFAKAKALSLKQPLWEYFRSLSKTAPQRWTMPVPLMNVMNGGKHAVGASDFQEFMIVPAGAASFAEAMDMGVSIFMALKKQLHKAGYATTVGDEGGFAPSLGSNEASLAEVMKAISAAGYEAGKDVFIALDVAASELYKDGQYHLESEKRTLSPAELIEMYAEWARKYPVISIEDGLDQDAWSDYTSMTTQMGEKVQIVGDDFFVTNVKRLERGIAEKACNSILIKLNQIGSVTETVAAIDMARQNGMTAIVSHRSGETEDATIADFVVGLGTGQIKTGSLSRSDRMAKYNQLLRIAEALGDQATYPGVAAFHRQA